MNCNKNWVDYFSPFIDPLSRELLEVYFLEKQNLIILFDFYFNSFDFFPIDFYLPFWT